MFLPKRNVISAILIPAECYPCSENIAGTINQSLVWSFVIESRITSFSRVLLGPARTRGSDYPIGTGFPFVDRHSSVFSRRILLYLPLVPFCSRAAAVAAAVVALHPSVLLMRSSGNEGTRGGTGGGRAIHEGTKTAKWRSKEVKK